jgi:hypothetical protein
MTRWDDRPQNEKRAIVAVAVLAALFAVGITLQGLGYMEPSNGVEDASAPADTPRDRLIAALTAGPYGEDNETTDGQARLLYVELEGSDQLQAATIQLNVAANEMNAVGQWEIAEGIHSVFHENPDLKIAAAKFQLVNTPVDDYGNDQEPEIVYSVTFDANQAAEVNWDRWKELPWDRLWTVVKDEMP